MSAGRRIEDYALIGDGETAALVGRDGSIDWLCWPRFDSSACFAALVGTRDNGRWLIAPAEEIRRTTRQYRDRTLILETVFETTDGTVALIDFMPPRGDTSDVVRLVVGRRGRVAMRTEFIVRFGYGAILPWVSKAEPHVLRAIGGPDMVVLRTPIDLQGKGFTTVGEFTVGEGETISFVLSDARSNQALPRAIDPHQALRETEDYWREWTKTLPDSGPWPDALARSLITLKAMIYRPSGGVVAAPTTSLPETPHGKRNWDYRLCWLRDAAFALLALMNNGYFEEAKAWHEWLIRSIAGDPAEVQVMYGLTGERHLGEWEPDWLRGFNDADPVRIGNAASKQLQLDVYGDVVDALYQGHCSKVPIDPIGWSMQKKLLDHLEAIWQEPDNGIWELRVERQQYTYSKVMVWVAFDRALRSIERFGLDGPVERWRAVQERVKQDICRKGFDESRGCFVQRYGSKDLDASLLLMPLVGFLPATDARVRSTVEAIERELMLDGLVMRYRPSAGYNEGAFLPCSFWLADNFTLLGRRNDAVDLLERLLSLRNDVGLLPEEYDARTKCFTGNFPQVFSHVAMVNTIHNLTRSEKPAEQRPQGRFGRSMTA